MIYEEYHRKKLFSVSYQDKEYCTLLQSNKMLISRESIEDAYSLKNYIKTVESNLYLYIF